MDRWRCGAWRERAGVGGKRGGEVGVLVNRSIPISLRNSLMELECPSYLHEQEGHDL